MPLLQASAISVQFGGLQALSEVDLDVDAGSITGLIGPNGAGKTTMFNVICGLQPTTTGHVTYDGKQVTGLKTHERARLGIARTFQRLEVFGSLSARENILVGAEIRARWSSEKVDPEAVTEAILDRVDLRRVAEHRVDTMPTGLARLVELGRALAAAPKLLLLDEPSSGLSEEETVFFAALLRSLTAEGLGILLVEHDVELVMDVCARIHVLDFGRKIAAGTPSEIQKDQAVQAAYLGAGADDAA
ncbi:MAG: ATP-binding cassette domain-containing protein [Actinobacteria bacterium]|nr:MAG: ATP-binding cassette domain-containing protein [Actinomycetota bacterium]